jgi:hypothetical protein
MGYKNLIVEKKLSVDQLPKRLQKKIADCESLSERIQSLESLNLDEQEKDALFEMQQKLSSLGWDIEKAVRKFNPEVYRKRMDHIKRITKKKDADETNEEPQEEPELEEQKETIKEEVSEEPKDIDIVELRSNKIKQDLEELKKQIQIKPESYEPQIEADEDQEQSDEKPVEDFQKTGNATPKKMSKSLILMGVGAFLLTWGAVNFFKERRG